MFTEQLSEMSAEIGRLKIELKIALVYLKQAKKNVDPVHDELFSRRVFKKTC